VANELETFVTPGTTIDPITDLAGNMTTIPQPKLPGSAYTLKYDAWNRLVEVKSGTTVVQVNEYDGLNRRIVRDETGGSYIALTRLSQFPGPQNTRKT